MNIVIVLGTYYPNPSPTALVADQMIQFYKKTHKVYVICQKNNKDNENRDNEKEKGIIKIEIGNTIAQFERWIQIMSRKRNRIQRGIFQIISRIVFPIKVLKNIMVFPNGEQWYINKANGILEKINKDVGIDCLITVCAPFSAHVAGYHFKENHEDIKWCVYTPDVFSEGIRANKNALYRALQYKRAIHWEDMIYSKADWIVHMDRVFESHENVKSDRSRSMVLYTQMQFFNAARNNDNYHKDVICLYAGSFLPGIREPFFMVEAFSALFYDHPEIKLALYGNLGYTSYFESFRNKYPNNVVLHEPVSKRELAEIIEKATFLINVGNSTEGFIPSKIYEYVATGIPIITFSYTGRDNLTLLRYPMHYQVNTMDTNTKEAIKGLALFISKSKFKRVDHETLNKIYNEHIREVYEQKLNEIID